MKHTSLSIGFSQCNLVIFQARRLRSIPPPPMTLLTEFFRVKTNVHQLQYRGILFLVQYGMYMMSILCSVADSQLG